MAKNRSGKNNKYYILSVSAKKEGCTFQMKKLEMSSTDRSETIIEEI